MLLFRVIKRTHHIHGLQCLFYLVNFCVFPVIRWKTAICFYRNLFHMIYNNNQALRNTKCTVPFCVMIAIVVIVIY